MNPGQIPRPWWKDNRPAWVLAVLTFIGSLITTILGHCLAIFRRVTTNPLLTAFAAFIVATVVVVSFTLGFYSYGGEFLKNILVEAHGMLLDILVIGIFILWLNRKGEKRLENRRYQEEIDDFREWKSDEAGYRIAGNIRRLNRNGITNIRLEGCHLVKVNLSYANLSRANLFNANLSGAKLGDANLSRAQLSVADLNLRANLSGAYLSGADLSYAILLGANLSGDNLSGTNLSDAILSDAILSGVDPANAILDPVGYSAIRRHASLRSADLSGTKGWTNEQLAQAESLVGVILPNGTVMTEEAWEEFKKRYRQ
jgi:BTB/POZ domain-containing protein KCTD9